MKTLALIIKNPVVLIIPVLILFIFSSGVILPIKEVLALAPIMGLAGAVAYYEKDKRLIKFFWGLCLVIFLIGLVAFYNTGKKMKSTNLHRYEKMQLSDMAEWDFGYNESLDEHSFYRKIGDKKEFFIEWF